ncbi:MAG: p-benzoquinone reductase [Candidatus Anoxychlamydiales bacterium]|nr:p-benzoquinone reductase [Candidatus Anoxychlamydiales bacterium]
MKILVLYYSMYGHVYSLAKEIAKGATQISSAEVEIKKVPETLSDDILEKMGALKAKEIQKDIEVATVEDLEKADAIIFGTPTRFGNMCAQMRSFLDATGGLWMSGALVGKVGSVFTSSATQHGGQESTILTFHTNLLHHGMIIVGLPYTFEEQMQTDTVMGLSPYGVSTIAGTKGERSINDHEKKAAEFLGKRVAEITKKMST